jgi:hypothetical protein
MNTNKMSANDETRSAWNSNAKVWDAIKLTYSVKTSQYLTPYQAHGVVLRNRPKPQLYFERPIQYYLNLGFMNGFVLDGFAERAFPPEFVPSHPLSWGGQFSEIPPVLVARLRLM